ncbi:hypothetical protein cypCar_00043961, partial [Cyprinus carpio]
MCKFRYPTDSVICEQELLNDSCEQSNSFTCRYTTTTAMTEKFSFFVQTKCGVKQTEFTVDISDISVSCDDVTGSVGKEVTLTCNVSLQSGDCSIKMCMFRYPNDSAICEQELLKDSSFACRYTPTTAMTENFSFFVQTNCGSNATEFTVDVT